MAGVRIVRYRPGSHIDPACTLVVENLKPHQWGPLEQAYPVLRAVSPQAPFRQTGTVTIFPPHFVAHRGQLERLLPLYQSRHASGDERLYPLRRGKALLAFAYYSTDGYPQLHIYFTSPPHTRRWRC